MKNEEDVAYKEQRDVHSKSNTCQGFKARKNLVYLSNREKASVVKKVELGVDLDEVGRASVDHVRSLDFIVGIRRRYLKVLSRE